MAHEGYTVLICRPDGRIDGGDDGLWDLDARMLSRHVLRLDGQDARDLGSCVADAGRWSTAAVIPRRGGDAVGPNLPQDTWAIRIDRVVGDGMIETIRVTNHAMVPATARLELDLDADFRDRLRPAGVEPDHDRETTWDGASRMLRFETTARYQGRVDSRACVVTMDTTPSTVEPLDGAPPTARRSTFDLGLGPGGTWRLGITYGSIVDGRERSLARVGARRQERRAAWHATRTRATTTERLVGPAFERAADDLASLRNWDLGPIDDDRAWVVNAGVPGFTGFFGRDALTAGWQAAMLGPEPLRGALAMAVASQGQRDDPWTEEEPGRMVHEMRRGPLASLGARPHARYYGTQTTGSIFLLGLSELWHWTGDTERLRRYRPAAMRAIEWAETLGDRDGDGFLEYRQRATDGLKNQGWKDSNEAIRYPDGRIVENPIATVEEQAFHFLALQRMAEILVALDEDADRAAGLLRRAADLRDAWHAAYWLPDERFYALALDPDHVPVATITSNPGHALASGIVPPRYAAAVADRLLATDIYSGWGVRTLSAAHPSYNPYGYHLGTVWPVENATIALGFKRYGLDDHLDQLVDGFFGAVAHCRDLRLPEALTGHDRSDAPVPLPYPGATSPQAWSASATVQMVQVMLGLYPFAPAGVLGLVRPRLPAW
ncbi:MAG: glycogen debranching N-terminal domain-containing protein, partial [Candidatus Limnocylindrales bacterium]